MVLTFPGSLESDWVGTRFEPGQARSLDCDDLLDGLFMFPRDLPEDGFVQGFLRIQAESALNVVARYTASGSEGEPSSQVVPIEGTRARMARPRRGDHKEKICHVPPGNPDNEHNIEVDSSSVPAHLAHGDYRGECDNDVHHD